MTKLNSKLVEWIFVIAFAIVMVVAVTLPLGRHTRVFTLLGVSVVGLAAYFYLFRDRFRGRWLKVSIVATVGALLGGVIMFVYLHGSHT